MGKLSKHFAEQAYDRQRDATFPHAESVDVGTRSRIKILKPIICKFEMLK